MRTLEEEEAEVGFEESIAATDEAAADAAEATPAASSPATSTVIGCGLEEEEEEAASVAPAPLLRSSRAAAATAESVEGLSLPDECSARTRAPEPLGGTDEEEEEEDDDAAVWVVCPFEGQRTGL